MSCFGQTNRGLMAGSLLLWYSVEHVYTVESLIISILYLELNVLGDDASMS